MQLPPNHWSRGFVYERLKKYIDGVHNQDDLRNLEADIQSVLEDMSNDNLDVQVNIFDARPVKGCSINCEFTDDGEIISNSLEIKLLT